MKKNLAIYTELPIRVRRLQLGYRITLAVSCVLMLLVFGTIFHLVTGIIWSAPLKKLPSYLGIGLVITLIVGVAFGTLTAGWVWVRFGCGRNTEVAARYLAHWESRWKQGSDLDAIKLPA